MDVSVNTVPELSHSFDISDLVELLQQSALEHFTVFRQLEAEKFSSLSVIVTTDFEALYAYQSGDYQRCLRLSTDNVLTLVHVELQRMSRIYLHPELIELMDDDIVSLLGLKVVVDPSFRDKLFYTSISQLYLSLYLMTQCQMKLHHSLASLTQTLVYAEVARRHLHEFFKLDRLLLKLIERKILLYITAKINQQFELYYLIY